MRQRALLIVLLACVASPSRAHVTLEGKQAAVGSYYKAVFAVPHGCAGSATTKLRVQIPDGVIGVKPMPKAGWNVDTVTGKYSRDYDYHGGRVSEGVKEVVWSGGKLPDHNYDEFVISTFLTDTLKPDTTLYFPVVQECEQGISRWIDMPAAGQDNGSRSPAPGVKLIAKPQG